MSSSICTCCMSFPLGSCLSHPGKLYDQPAIFSTSDTQKATCLWLFAEHLSDYSDYTVIYTDRSLLHSLTSCAFIYEFQVFSYYLHSFNTMFTTELYAMHRALLYIHRQPWQCHLLCADSLNSLRRPLSCRHNCPGTVETLWQISDYVRWGNPLCFAGYLAIWACTAMKLLGRLPPMECCSEK